MNQFEEITPAEKIEPKELKRKENPHLAKPSESPDEDFFEEIKEIEATIKGEKLTELRPGCIYVFFLKSGENFEAIFNGWRGSRVDLTVTADEEKGKDPVNLDKSRHSTYDPRSFESIEIN